MKKILLMLISLGDKIISKDENSILFSSFPDMSDNSFAFFVYLCHIGIGKSKKIIWLLDDLTKVDETKKMLENYLEMEDVARVKYAQKKSLKAALYYMKSKYVFFTHGIFTGVKIPKGHIVVNLWHGMPLKNIGYLDGKIHNLEATLVLATSKVYQEIISHSFRIPRERVLVCGQPRCDFLQKKINIRESLLDGQNFKKIILWLPTYRQSIIGDIRLDGKFRDGLPVLSWDDLDGLDNYLRAKNYILLVKLHLMDMLNEYHFKNYDNIKIFTSRQFAALQVNLYSLLGSIDLLLTDYSSVYIDYLLTQKPFGFLLDDLETYSNTRGFVFRDFQKYMPAKIINSYDELVAFVDDSFNEKDEYVDFRRRVCDEFHEVKRDFSKTLYDVLRKDYGF